MSRLDSFIRRVSAQRDILNVVTAQVSRIEGPVFELGLGNGRTYHHLREKLPGRYIIVFDRKLAAHPRSVPPDENFVPGEIRETAQAFVGANGALVHADIGTTSDEIDAVTMTWLPDLTAGLLRSGGYAVSGLPLEHPALLAQPLPASVPEDRYFIYRRI